MVGRCFIGVFFLDFEILYGEFVCKTRKSTYKMLPVKMFIGTSF
jgi:hypothetical protein